VARTLCFISGSGAGVAPAKKKKKLSSFPVKVLFIIFIKFGIWGFYLNLRYYVAVWVGILNQ
jgi:hypothetical protein